MLNFNRAGHHETYKTVATSDLLTIIREKFSDSLDIESVSEIQGYGTTSICEIPFHIRSKVSVDDVIPRLLIANSLNRESSLNIALGIFRLVCTNGLVVGHTTMSQRIIHRSGPKIANFLETFTDSVEAAITRLNDGIAEVNELVDIKIPDARSAIDFLADLDILTVRAHAQIVQQFDNDDFRPEDRVHLGNAWGILNVANESLELSRTARSTPISVYQRNRRIVPALRSLVA